MKKLLIISFLIVFISNEGISQLNWLDNFRVRKSFDNNLSKQEAASLNLIFPGDTTANSFNIDMAIGYSISNENYIFSPEIEIRKNNNIAKKQDVCKAGVNIEANVIRLPTFYFVSTLRVNYKSDDIEESNSMEGKFYLSPIFENDDCRSDFWNYILPDLPKSFRKILSFNYNPTIGLEYENKYKAENVVEETMTRFYFNSQLRILPFYKLNEKFELLFNYTLREDLKESENFDEKTHQLYSMSAIYSITDNIQIGLDHKSGENPSNGFEKQDVTSFSFKIKI